MTLSVYVSLAFIFIVIFAPETQCCVKQVKNLLTKEFPTTPKPITLTTLILSPLETTKEPPAQLSEDDSGVAPYAQYGSSGFFVEVEESLDKTVKVHQLKSLPKIYSQIFLNETKNKSSEGNETTESPNFDIIQMDETLEPQTPPIESLKSDGENSDNSWTQDDENVRRDWGGDCKSSNWVYCNRLRKITVWNVFNKTVGRDTVFVHLDLDCLLEPIVCLYNGWTCNRCHILCMSKCNRAILLGWDKLVSYEGGCRYI